MLTAQPSTYDMFGLIELYGRKLQSEYMAGFSFQISRWGGNGPPLRGGTQGGVIGQQGGGMARDPDATMKHLILLCKQGV